MKLSRILIFYIFLVVIVPNLLLVQGASTDLQVTFATNPTIVPPGTNGLLEVNLKSLSGTVNNINIDVLSWDSSAIYARGNWEVRVGDLPGGDSTSVLYEFYVPSSAKPGLYQIVFEISSSAGVFKQTAIIRVEDSTLLDLVSVTPSSISIGRASTVFFNITNNGGTSSGNILFTWEDPSSLILPVGSDNRITVSSIAPGNYTEIPVNIMASPSITPGVYPLTVNIQFYDQTGTIQTVTSIVGLQIGGTTDFEIERMSDYYLEGSMGYLLVFDLTSLDSLEKLNPWYKKAVRICGDIPFIILGNKNDLEEFVKVGESDIQTIIKDKYQSPIFKTSAKTGENVESAIFSLVESIMR